MCGICKVVATVLLTVAVGFLAVIVILVGQTIMWIVGPHYQG